MNNGKDPPPCAYYHFIKKEMVKTSSLVGRKEGMRGRQLGRYSKRAIHQEKFCAGGKI